MADKGLFAGFAIISILQVNSTSPEIWGLFAVLIGLNSAILTISDSVALVNILQFGINEDNAPKVNLFALTTHTILLMLLPLLLFFMKDWIAMGFSNPDDIIAVLTFLPIFNLSCLLRYFCLKFVYKYSEMKKLFFINLMYFLPITLITLYGKYYLKIEFDFLDFVYMYMAGNILSSIVALAMTYKKIKLGKQGDISIKQMMDFSIPLLFTQFLHAMPKQLDSLIILFFFDKKVNGIYSTAKTFFRVFEETLSAAQGLLYPAFIRRINKNDITTLKELVSKSISFLFVTFLGILIAVQLGAVDFIFVHFIDSKFIDASRMFTILSLASIFLPFLILTALLNAELKTKLLLKYVLYSVVSYLSAMVIIGYIGNPMLIPLGYIIYTSVLGLLGLSYYKKTYDYQYKEIFTSLLDAKNYISSLKKKKKSIIN